MNSMFKPAAKMCSKWDKFQGNYQSQGQELYSSQFHSLWLAMMMQLFTYLIYNSQFSIKWKATILRLPSGFSHDILGRLEGTYAKSTVHLIGRDPEISFCSVVIEKTVLGASFLPSQAEECNALHLNSRENETKKCMLYKWICWRKTV